MLVLGVGRVLHPLEVESRLSDVNAVHFELCLDQSAGSGNLPVEVDDEVAGSLLVLIECLSEVLVGIVIGRMPIVVIALRRMHACRECLVLLVFASIVLSCGASSAPAWAWASSFSVSGAFEGWRAVEG